MGNQCQAVIHKAIYWETSYGSVHKGIPTNHHLSSYEDAGASTDDN
jgi:hypothetical protein